MSSTAPSARCQQSCRRMKPLMNEQQEFGYYVVEFLDPPFPDIDAYVCIPDCWIRYREGADPIGIVSYPKERLPDIEKLVEDKSSFREGWTISGALLIHGTDSYTDAQNYIAGLGNSTSQNDENQHIAEDDDMSSSSDEHSRKTFKYQSYLNIRNSTTSVAPTDKKTATSHTTEFEQTSLSTQNKGDETTADETLNIVKYYTKKHRILSQCSNETPTTCVRLNSNIVQCNINSNENNCHNRNTDNSESSVDSNSLELRKKCPHCVHEIPSLSGSSFSQKCKVKSHVYHRDKCQCKLDESEAINMNEKKSDTYQCCSMKHLSQNPNENSSTRKHHLIKNTAQEQQELRSNVYHIDKSTDTDDIGDSPVNSKDPKSVDSTKSERPNIGPDISAVLEYMYDNLGKTIMVLDDTRLAYCKDRLYIKQLINRVDNHNNERILEKIPNVVVAEKENEETVFKKQENLKVKQAGKVVTANISQQKKDIETLKEKQKIIDGNTKNKELDEVNPKKKLFQPHKCREHFSKENAKNSSKSTLRYRTKRLGLVELMPYSGIYVNELRLKNCTRIARDSRTLARLLLLEVFNDKALATCSFTGKKSRNGGSVTRPGLDAHGRMVLLTFVEEHRLAKKWDDVDNDTIMKSIRSKMNEMRTKFRRSRV